MRANVAWLVPHLDARRASLRYRCLYPLQALQQLGFAAELFDPAKADQYQCVVFDAWLLFPSIHDDESADDLVALATQLHARGQRIVLDNCDNQFAISAQDTAWQRGLQRLLQVVRVADSLIVCSHDLAEVMRRETGYAGKISVIGDPVEEKIAYPGDSLLRNCLSPKRKLSWLRYLHHRQRIHLDQAQGRTPLVWFGSHGNHFAEGGMLDLLPLRPMLEEMNRQRPLSLTIISNHQGKFDTHFKDWGFPLHYLAWDRINFLAALKLHTISLIPTQVNDFTRCKSANRVVLSLTHGLAVVADEVPSYREFKTVASIGNIGAGLPAYLDDPQLRTSHVQSGRALIEARYSLPVIAAHWHKALFEL